MNSSGQYKLAKAKHMTLILIVMCLAFAFPSVAATKKQTITSKLQEIELTYQSDSQKALNLAKELILKYPENAKVIYWLGRLYPIFSEFELGSKFAKKALTLNISAHDKAYMYLSLAYHAEYEQDAEQQFRYLEQSIKYAEKTEDPELIVEALSIYSGVLAKNNKIDKALDYMTQSYELVDNVTSPDALSTMYDALCTIYIKTGHLDGAIEAMLKSIEYVRLSGNTQQLSVAYYNLADIYIQSKDYKEAINAYKNSERFSRISGDIIGIAYAYMGMGRSYLRAEQYEQALTVLQDAKQRFLTDNYIGNLIQIFGDLASTQYHLKMYPEAQQSLNELEALKSYQTEKSSGIYLQAIQTQSQVLFALKKYQQAYQTQERYIEQLSDYYKQQIELSNDAAFEKLKNSIYAKDNELLVLENQLKKVELDKHKKQSDLLLITSLFSICIAIFVTFILSRNIKLQKQLDKLATTDDLTGLYNRRKIMAILSTRFNLFKKSKQPLYVCMFDLDLFKRINDQYGHVMGDEVLKHIANCAMSIFKKDQPIGRYGGEEFLIILNSDSYQAAYSALEDFRLAIEQLDIPGVSEPITISLGLSEASMHDAYQTDIIQRADTALYDAKKSGRNQLCGK